MKLFLDVARSINYIGYIINDIKGVRDRLRELYHDKPEGWIQRLRRIRIRSN